MELSQRCKEYWGKNLKVTGILLGIWAFISFPLCYMTESFNSIVIAGFPLGFYMQAQGNLIIYVLIIWYYQKYMNNLDIEYDVHEGDE